MYMYMYIFIVHVNERCRKKKEATKVMHPIANRYDKCGGASPNVIAVTDTGYCSVGKLHVHVCVRVYVYNVHVFK